MASCDELLALVDLLSDNDDGIKMNQKLRPIFSLLSRECETETYLSNFIGQIITRSLQDESFAIKTVILTSSHSFSELKLFNRRVRSFFLSELQSFFEELKQNFTTNINEKTSVMKNCNTSHEDPFYNYVILLGEYYNRARLADGTLVHPLGCPIIDCLQMFIDSRKVRAAKDLCFQLSLNGRLLIPKFPDKMKALMVSARFSLLESYDKTLQSYLLLAIDLVNHNFNFDKTIEDFYAAVIDKRKVDDTKISLKNKPTVVTDNCQQIQEKVDASHTFKTRQYSAEVVDPDSDPKYKLEDSRTTPYQPVTGSISDRLKLNTSRYQNTNTSKEENMQKHVNIVETQNLNIVKETPQITDLSRILGKKLIIVQNGIESSVRKVNNLPKVDSNKAEVAEPESRPKIVVSDKPKRFNVHKNTNELKESNEKSEPVSKFSINDRLKIHKNVNTSEPVISERVGHTRKDIRSSSVTKRDNYHTTVNNPLNSRLDKNTQHNRMEDLKTTSAPISNRLLVNRRSTNDNDCMKKNFTDDISSINCVKKSSTANVNKNEQNLITEKATPAPSSENVLQNATITSIGRGRARYFKKIIGVVGVSPNVSRGNSGINSSRDSADNSNVATNTIEKTAIVENLISARPDLIVPARFRGRGKLKQ